MKKKNLAFTLAEVLIVIGIIGVVAALTLPNLNHATGDKETVTKVKKVYSSLTEAVDRAQVIYGPFDTWFNGTEDYSVEAYERFAKRVTEFMKVSKDCGTNSGCFSTAPYLEADGNEIVENFLADLQNYGYYMVMLPDGISLSFGHGSNAYQIKADIDGPNKGKNQYGSDIFDFAIYVDKEIAASDGMIINQLYPSSMPTSWTGDLTEGSTKGQYSTAWVIENGNLDYLKCYDELNWETKTSCE